MSASLEEIIKSYLRALSEYRNTFAFCFLVVAVGTIIAAATWPNSYTSSATIYGDNSNILPSLMEGNAVPTSINDQAQMAQEILFNREFNDEVLEAGGWDPAGMTQAEKEELVRQVQNRTEITNVGRGSTNLIQIAYTDSDPVRAFGIAQKYTSLFIEESVVDKREESRNAFEFIQNQVAAYQQQLEESEQRLSEFKSEHNYGTLSAANSRVSNYRAEIEELELELMQLDTEEKSVQDQLAGQREVSRDLTETNALRERINSLQMQLDTLRSRYHDTYPDVVQIKTQIQDLREMLESGNMDPAFVETGELDNEEGVTPLHQELRSKLAEIRTRRQSITSQLEGLRSLLAAEQERIERINQSEAELAELTRDYNVTQDFYNQMLKRLENARVSVQLDEQQQGMTFKVQESAVIPTQPDGLNFPQLLVASFIFALAVPAGLLVLYMELDPRIRSESNWSEDWPPLLMTVAPLKSANRRWISDRWFAFYFYLLVLFLYGGAVASMLVDANQVCSFIPGGLSSNYIPFCG